MVYHLIRGSKEGDRKLSCQPTEGDKWAQNLRGDPPASV